MVKLNYTNVMPEDIQIFIGANESSVEFNLDPPADYYTHGHSEMDNTPLVEYEFMANVLWDVEFIPKGNYHGKNLYVVVTPAGNFEVLSKVVRMNVTCELVIFGSPSIVAVDQR